jgi:alkylation response protein AidB-like acyl-CoA dehydrogenase
MLTLVPTHEQQQITEAVREMLQAEWPLERLRAWGAREDPARWPGLATLGAFGTGIAVDQGGLGLSVVEETLVLREFGRALLPPTVLATVLAAHVAAAGGRSDLCASLLEGRQPVGVLNALRPCTLGEQVSGTFHAIDSADCELLLVWGAAGGALIARCHCGPLGSRACIDDTLALACATLEAAPALAWLPATQQSVARRADVLLAAYLVGIAEAARDMAVGYAGLREAFGQPIGAFQAIKHRCADAAVRAEAAWCQTLAAAIGLRDASSEAATDVAAARWLADEAARSNAESNVQVHGGIGFSAEALPHRFVKRSVVMAGLGARDLRRDLLQP